MLSARFASWPIHIVGQGPKSLAEIWEKMKQISTLLLSLAVAALVGCRGSSSKITKENFERIHEGMTKAEVVAILGKPTGKETVAEMNGRKTSGVVWKERRTKITVAFSPDDKLVVKSIESE